MSPDRKPGDQGQNPPPVQLSFDDLAALRASDEANADSVIAELLSLPSTTRPQPIRPASSL